MTLEVTGIALAVDSREAVTAKDRLQQMAQAGNTAASAFDQVAARSSGAGAALSATASAAAAGSKATAAAGVAAKSSTDALRQTGNQAKLTGNQAAQLSAQLQDLFVQVQAGGSPLTALIQQGSQLSAVFGGVGPALRAVATVAFSTAGALVAVAAAGVGLGAAFAVGAEQSAELRRALILSGNAAGITVGEFEDLARAVAEATKTTQGSARETLLGLAGSGQITGDVLSSAAVAAQLLAKVTGQASGDIVRDFSRAADGPTKFAADLNRSFNFLTASQLDYIRKLEEQGRGQEALAQTFVVLIPRLQEAAGQTTALGSAAGFATREISAFISSLQALGRDQTAEERLAGIKAQIDELAKSGQRGYVFGPSVADLRVQLAAAQAVVDAQRKAAQTAAEQAKREKAIGAFNALQDLYLSREEQRKKAILILDEKAAAAGAKGSKAYLEALAEINQRFDNGQNKARLASDLADIQANEQRRIAVYKQSEGVIDALRQAGIVSEAEFYAAKRGFVQLEEQAQAAAIQAEIARLQQFRGTATEQLEVRRQITQAEEKLAEVRSSAAARNLVLNVQEKSAADALKRSYVEAEAAAVNAFNSATRVIAQRGLDVGRSDRERAQAAEIFGIQQNYTRQLEQLDADYRNGSLRGKADEYQKRRILLLDNQEFEINAARDGYARLAAEQAKWANGASAALQNYADNARNTAQQVNDLFTNAFQGVEDALVKFVTTGKLSFSDLASSIVADITRIIIKQQLMLPLMQALGLGGGGGGSGGGSGIGGLISSGLNALFGGGRAAGGPVQAGRVYAINETKRGPGEILNVGGAQYLMATANGTVSPNQAGGGMSVHNTFILSQPADRRTQQQVAASAGLGVQRAMARNT